MTTVTVNGVDVVHWNPRRPVRHGRIGRAIPIRRRVNNFGDLIGPAVVRELLGREAPRRRGFADRRARLLSVGSIVHLAQQGDVVWGSGVNGKHLNDIPSGVDIRAIRGPMTREVLTGFGYAVPEIYGDPAMLLGTLFPPTRLRPMASDGAFVFVPNLHDVRTFRGSYTVVDPKTDMWTCIRRIAGAEFVVSSSLHGLIVAETYGVGARLVRPGEEPMFKYRDYYESTGRPDFQAATTVAEAVAMGPEVPPRWSPDALLESFPRELWR